MLIMQDNTNSKLLEQAGQKRPGFDLQGLVADQLGAGPGCHRYAGPDDPPGRSRRVVLLHLLYPPDVCMEFVFLYRIFQTGASGLPDRGHGI